MEIRYFIEKFDHEYGSVFIPSDSSCMSKVSNADWFLMNDSTDALEGLEDFKHDKGYEAFKEAIGLCSKAILFGKDGIFPGNICGIWQIIIGEEMFV